jgi:hypothetical protein
MYDAAVALALCCNVLRARAALKSSSCPFWLVRLTAAESVFESCRHAASSLQPTWSSNEACRRISWGHVEGVSYMPHGKPILRLRSLISCSDPVDHCDAL